MFEAVGENQRTSTLLRRGELFRGEQGAPLLEIILRSVRQDMELHIINTRDALRPVLSHIGKGNGCAIDNIDRTPADNPTDLPLDYEGGIFIDTRPRLRGFWATAPSRRPRRPRSPKWESITTSLNKPSPGAISRLKS
jgi:hypothetical protein